MEKWSEGRSSMPQDKSANKRNEMSLKIGNKEREMDELSREQRQVEENLERQQQQFSHGFKKIENLHLEQQQLGDTDAQKALSVNQNIQQAVQQTLRRQREELHTAYRSTYKRIEKEREDLSKER